MSILMQEAAYQAHEHSRSPSPHNAEYGRRSPDRPEGSVTSEAFGYQFRKSSDSSTSRSSELGSEDNVQRSTEEMFDMYPGMLAYLISDSLRDMFGELRGRRAKKRNTVNMETLITMGVLQEGFKQWHELLSKAGTAKLPGITQDKPDPFKIGMTLTLIQLCAHLEQAEFHLYGPNHSSNWEHAHNALDYCHRLGAETKDTWYSENESEEESSGLRTRSTDKLQPLARTLAYHGFPVASDEHSFDASVVDILRCRSSLDSLVSGLELRIYMSSLGPDVSSPASVYVGPVHTIWVNEHTKKSGETGRKGKSRDRALPSFEIRY
ncbi:hypothetical protein D6D19_06303 [Aureobasidium pullulans]|uniref:Uncharacterized protein n=1 Tax=Aureobasidium pullulans TaxID=5580 RepID=A0A4S9A1N8_AURPU|nr:hypothetical protein D6D19_06303 [Aureobasidium pullulans]